ncbi:MAG: hypothetical protein LQ346_005219 [Caloplaca aetnensis]|nr:MAG: hypothetical protein LQ346_005219 [Caloplaca aetnensis]
MDEERPRITHNPLLQRYYGSWESRLGYRLLLGGNRHFGYYEPGTIWPLPLSAAMRRTEDHLYDLLELPAGSEVLDAGCGNAFVALHFAHNGLRVQGIDMVENHVRRARQNIKAEGMDDMVTVRLADYHHLNWLSDMSLDGVYTMETFVHATDPQQVLSEFFRVLKPGGSIAMHEYWHLTPSELLERNTPTEMLEAALRVDQHAAMPAYKLLNRGVLKKWLKDQGFTDIEEIDLSENITPMCFFFFLLGYIPYLIICFLGLQDRFVNTEAGVQSYRGIKRGYWGKSAYKAKKPHKIGVGGLDKGMRARKNEYRLPQSIRRRPS